MVTLETFACSVATGSVWLLQGVEDSQLRHSRDTVICLAHIQTTRRSDTARESARALARRSPPTIANQDHEQGKLPRESPHPHLSEQVLCLPQNRQHSCLKRTSLAERSKRPNSLRATMRRLRSHTADYTDDKAFRRTPIATPNCPACSRRPQPDQCTNKNNETLPPCRVWRWKQSLEFSASTIDLTHQVAKHAHHQHLAGKDGHREGNS